MPYIQATGFLDSYNAAEKQSTVSKWKFAVASFV